MLPIVILGVVFLTQIVLMSVFYPRRLSSLKSYGPAATQNRGREAEPNRGVSFGAYARVNHIIGALGLVLLPALLYLAMSGRMTVALLSIGLFFLLQLSPLALPSVRRIWSRGGSVAAQHDAATADTYRSTRLLEVVGVGPISIAALFFLSYILLSSREVHLPMMAVFTSTQLLLAGSIAWAVLSLRRAPAGQVGERYQNLRRLAPLFVFASIMVSVYYFGKELLGIFDEPQLRPTMMSAFLQLVGACVFYVLYSGKGRVHGLDVERS